MRSAPVDDLILADMKSCLRRHLSAALIECAALARDLDLVDPDVIVAGIRSQFDPEDSIASIQDCFSDAFYSALDQAKPFGGEALAARTELPSGAPGRR